ncbi:hypothetical protein UXO11_22545 [Enterobacter wuhouensis]|uniref:hypothetical protein n=1 Tax=Enterobacter wuhouensis TaxID=2529381 RepID=UPI002FD2F9EF
MARTLVRRALKSAYFMLLTIAVARAFGRPEIYINHNLASWLAQVIAGDVNAESMYDAYFYIDVTCVAAISTIIYLITMKLKRKLRSK